MDSSSSILLVTIDLLLHVCVTVCVHACMCVCVCVCDTFCLVCIIYFLFCVGISNK